MAVFNERLPSNNGAPHHMDANVVQAPVAIRPAAGGLHSFLATMRRRLIVVLVTFFAVLGFFVAYLATRQDLYQSVTVVDLNPNGSSGGGFGDVFQQWLDYDEINSQVATQVEVLSGDSLALDTCQQMDLLRDPAFVKLLGGPLAGNCNSLPPHERTLVLDALHGIVKADSVPGTNLVRITATSPDRQLSMRIANGLVSAFINSNLKAGVAGTDEVRAWLNDQMQSLSGQVQNTQKDLAQFQRSHDIVGSDAGGATAVEELGMIQTQLSAAAADRIQKEALLRIAESSSPELLSSTAEGGGIAALRNQKLQLQAEYDELTTKFGPGYPRVGELAQQIKAVQTALDIEISNIRRKLQNDYQAAVDVENGLNARYKEKQAEAFQLNDSAARYAILRQNAQSARDLYNAIGYRLRESGITDTLKSAKIRVIEPAVLADGHIYPRRGRMGLFGFLVALFSAVLAAYLVNYIDDSLNLPEMAESLTGLPILVMVPHLDTVKAVPNARVIDNEVAPRLVALTQPMSAASEAYRALRSSILLSRADGDFSVQLVTSPSEKEGKSLTAANYAITLAQQGRRVLLVDGDLRRGGLHSSFGIPRSPGLSELLSSSATIAPTAAPIKSVPGLDVIPAGPFPPNPSELLNSHRFDTLVDEWRQAYDFIIIDSAPILPVADSHPLAAKADLVMLVVRLEQTKSRSLLRTAQLMRRLGARVAGIVANDITSRSQGYNYYYYNDAYTYAAERAE